jgi:hypothetical protein
MNMVVAPPDDDVAFRGKQIRIGAHYTLDSVNAAVVVEKPLDSIDLKEASKRITESSPSGILSGDTDFPTNTNTNSNVNTNSNNNINATTDLNMNTNATSSTTDSDYDGLTDTEETAVYQTDPNKADTDGDGFSDKTEVCTGYNPLGAGKSSTTLPTPLSGCPVQ